MFTISSKSVHMPCVPGALRADYPNAISDEEFKELGHLAVVMAPVRIVTRLLEGEHPVTAAMYLPVLHQLKDAFSPRRTSLKVPSRLSSLFKDVIHKKDLVPSARKLMAFFHDDLDKLMKKHMDRIHPMLQMCTFLDPRFHAHPCMDASAKAAAAQAVAEWAFETHEKGEDIARHPDSRTMAEVLAEDQQGGRGKASGKGKGKHKGKAKQTKKAGPRCPRPPQKRKLQQRDSAEEFLWGPGAKQRSSLVDQDMVEGEEKIRRQIQEEMGRYEAIAVPPPGTVPCQWWHVHQCELPSLARVARMCMAIPGSSASVERAFSAFARLADRRRPRLQQANAAGLLFGHENLKRGWSGDRIRSQRHGDELERDGS